MKAINSYEIKISIGIFISTFILFLSISVVTVYLFMKANEKSFINLQVKVSELEKLESVRNDIIYNFDVIINHFLELSAIKSYDANDFSKQDIIIEAIQNANNKNKNLIDEPEYANKASFLLYKKLNTQIASMATIKDSLLTSKYAIESLKTQLIDCNTKNVKAIEKVRKGIFKIK